MSRPGAPGEGKRWPAGEAPGVAKLRFSRKMGAGPQRERHFEDWGVVGQKKENVFNILFTSHFVAHDRWIDDLRSIGPQHARGLQRSLGGFSGFFLINHP